MPTLYERDQCYFVVRPAKDDQEFAFFLGQKLFEEMKEFMEKPSDAEYADVLEVLETLATLYGLDRPTGTTAQREKRDQLGGFSKRLILEEFAWERAEAAR